ncbi:type II toxin-antitoxin system death-on-curing family toxin [Candidatus Bathyarchaeota archaeon]|nr:type II toxin-antitoxin system death-on-curing family toxin [Candidatus Bathyarchaeota archaeon]
MPPKVRKLKPNKHELSKPLKIPECGVKEDEVWYPPDWFLVSINEIMIKHYGGYTGFDLGLEPYQHIIKDAEEAQGIYRKAALLLKGIVTTRLFQDGHHRTAYIVVKTFLEKNDAEFKEKDERKIIRFIKDIRTYSIEEIESWLENGEL